MSGGEPVPVADCRWIEGSGSGRTHEVQLVDGEPTVVARAIDPSAVLLQAKADKWEEAKAYRENVANGECATPLGRVDCDPASQLKISGAVQMAMIAQAADQAFSIEWTMADNGIVTHDGPAMIQMGVAVGQHIAACQTAGNILREAIQAANSQAYLDVIVISDAPWPS